MATGMGMGTATETATGMVMDLVTETAMEMVTEEVTGVAMEMVTEMAMRLVVEEVEVEEAPQPVVAAGVVVVVEEEEEAVAVEAVVVAVAAAEVVIDMIFALCSRIVQVLMWRLSFSGHMSLQLAVNILLQCCIPSALNFVLDLVTVTLFFSLQLNSFDIDREDDVKIERSVMDQLLQLWFTTLYTLLHQGTQG
jgi:hypothetical protein